MSVQGQERICPLCGQDNNCQHDHEKCWCVSAVFPKDIFVLIPEEKRGRACICETCLEKHKKMKES